MKTKILTIFFFVIFITSCEQKSNQNLTTNAKKDTTSAECQEYFNNVKRVLGIGKYPYRLLVLETDSRQLKNKTVKQVLIDDNVKYPLDFSNVTIGSVENNKVVEISYHEHKNRDFSIEYIFKFSDTSKIYINQLEWYVSKNIKLKKEQLDLCLAVNDYCLAVVKFLWLPYLEYMSKSKDIQFYKEQKREYDSLQKIFDKIIPTFLLIACRVFQSACYKST